MKILTSVGGIKAGRSCQKSHSAGHQELNGSIAPIWFLKLFLAVAYIYRDERRMVVPPTVVYTNKTGAVSEEIVAAPTPGFGLKWSLNEMDPVVRSNQAFGLVEGRDYVKG